MYICSMGTKRKLEVSPVELNDWMISNKGDMHRMSLETVRELIDSNTDHETIKLVEFEWDNEIYASIYVHRDDMSVALESAEKYFVNNELFEEAIEARDLSKEFNNA